MEYTVVIRTLGKAGEKYQILLNSLLSQTIQPSAIIVYIADGYAIPSETIGQERYVYVSKGMVAQRALKYNEVKTEYILFLDDDVFMPSDGVEIMYKSLIEYNADVIAPDVFNNASRPLKSRILMSLTGRMLARRDDGKWAYKVMRNAGYSYNKAPAAGSYWSQTNAGPCFFCKKSDFLKINFEDELWLDNMPYAQGDDQAMFYKMYCLGMKQLTIFGSGIKHLDAGTTMKPYDKEKKLVYCDFRFKMIFWHRFILLPERSKIIRFWSYICILYTFLISFLISFFKFQFDFVKIKYFAIYDAISFIKSDDYNNLPKIRKVL